MIVDAARQDSVRGALELLDRASQMLSSRWRAALAVYLLGAVPFLLSLGYFVAEMSVSAFAELRLPFWCALLSVTYCFMKACQALFARQLLCDLRGEPPRRGVFFSALLQAAAWQPLGLLLAVASLALVLPLPWVVAFNFHASIPEQAHERAALFVARSLRQAALWPRQNHFLLLFATLVAMIVAVNASALFMLAPLALRTVFGVHTRFSEGGFTPLNSTMLTVILAVSYLATDPLLRAAYVLREFHATSRTDGRDLSVKLRLWRGTGVALLLLLLSTLVSAPAHAQDGERQAELDRALNNALQAPEFAWRAPRSSAAAGNGAAGAFETLSAWLEQAARSASHLLSKLLEWLSPPATGDQDGVASGSWSAAAVWGLLALTLSLVLVLLSRLLRRRPAVAAALGDGERPSPGELDVDAGAISPAALPSQEWRALAERLLQSGERRSGLRALFLNGLAVLHEHGLIAAGTAKSVADYRRELSARGHTHPELANAFASVSELFERAWYGSVEVDDAYIAGFRERHERLVGIEQA